MCTKKIAINAVMKYFRGSRCRDAESLAAHISSHHLSVFLFILIQDIEDESQVEKFWSELLKDEASEGIEQNFVDDGELGRGMRARKEVSYFGQEKFGSMEDALQSDGGKAEVHKRI